MGPCPAPADVASAPLEVVAGALVRADGRVLIAERPAGKARAGRWEFPGGKRLPSEAPLATLARELDEELGITPLAAERLLVVSHLYPEAARPVRIDCFRVLAWRGTPASLDGQRLAWCDIARLPQVRLLEADRPIVTALALPRSFRYVADTDALAHSLARSPPRCAYLSRAMPPRSLHEQLLARGDALFLLDPATAPPPGLGVVYSLREGPLPAFSTMTGALVGDAAAARAARAAGAAFLLCSASAEDFGELSLPLYCVRGASGALCEAATGELIWPAGT
jgi:mutator protein MutT